MKVAMVEGTDITRTLEITRCIFLGAGECYFGTLFAQKCRDLFVGDVADLVVVVDDLAILVTDTTFTTFHQCVTSLVVGTDVTVDAGPTFTAVAFPA